MVCEPRIVPSLEARAALAESLGVARVDSVRTWKICGELQIVVDSVPSGELFGVDSFRLGKICGDPWIGVDSVVSAVLKW